MATKKYVYKMFSNGEVGKVRVIAEGEGYYLVRRPNAAPFAVHQKECVEEDKLWISDGFGMRESVFCNECKMPLRHIVRPGKSQCGKCG